MIVGGMYASAGDQDHRFDSAMFWDKSEWGLFNFHFDIEIIFYNLSHIKINKIKKAGESNACLPGWLNLD